MFVGLKPRSQRPPAQVIAQQLFPRLMAHSRGAGVRVQPPGLGGGFGGAVQFVLQADTTTSWRTPIAAMMPEAQKLGYLVNMDTDLKLNKPQLEIEIDRERAAALGVSVDDIGIDAADAAGRRARHTLQARQSPVRSDAAGAGRRTATTPPTSTASTCAARRDWCSWPA